MARSSLSLGQSQYQVVRPLVEVSLVPMLADQPVGRRVYAKRDRNRLFSPPVTLAFDRHAPVSRSLSGDSPLGDALPLEIVCTTTDRLTEKGRFLCGRCWMRRQAGRPGWPDGGRVQIKGPRPHALCCISS